ncbi:hypothetical protein UNSW2_515 [Campylobacter concisus UNSW2]|uniref:Uncharacterized protein n=1 Tax=Campylobacter concisus UNSW2 TaxID=1242965 RepID=U2FND7_9BACT|nr:hypothetical protein UNSW2_515 [Campylobacter concisus UNSW2]
MRYKNFSIFRASMRFCVYLENSVVKTYKFKKASFLTHIKWSK